MSFLEIFNILSLIIFVGLGTLAAIRMVWRFKNFIQYGIPVPVLLKRDIILFITFCTYFGTALIALLIGAQGLSKEPLWVIPRGVMVLLAMAYWVWVEYHLEDGKGK